LRDAIEIISGNDFRRFASDAVEQEHQIDHVGRDFSTDRAWKGRLGIDGLIRPGRDQSPEQCADQNEQKDRLEQPVKALPAPACPMFWSWQT